jgi:hypothetical protein
MHPTRCKQSKIIPLFAILALSLASCSATPSENDAGAYWRNLISNSNGLISFVSFSKTDGKTMADGSYILFYALTYEFSDDCQYDSNFNAKKGIPQGLDSVGAFGMGHSIGNKGDQLIQSGEMAYEKRESGWQLVGVGRARISLSPETQARRSAAAQQQQQEIAKSKVETTEISSFGMFSDANQCPDRAVITDVSIKLHFQNGPYGRREGSETANFATISSISEVYVSVSGVVSFTIGSPELTGPGDNGVVRLAFPDRNAAQLLRNELIRVYQAWRAKFSAAH